MGKILLKFTRSVNAYKIHNMKTGRDFKYHQVQPSHSVDEANYYLAREARVMGHKLPSYLFAELGLNWFNPEPFLLTHMT